MTYKPTEMEKLIELARAPERLPLAEILPPPDISYDMITGPHPPEERFALALRFLNGHTTAGSRPMD